MLHLIRFLALLILLTSCVGKEHYEIRNPEQIPLPKEIGNSQLVGLGESTHGTIEFATLKASIIKDLIDNHGFNLLAIEANYLDTREVNIWLNGGEGNIDKLIKGLRYWTFDNSSFKNLLVWIRKYNSKNDRPVNLYGIDMQFVQQSIHEPFTYLKQYLAKDSLAYKHLQELDTISLEQLGNRFYNTPQIEYQEIKKSIGKALQLIETHLNAGLISDSVAFWHQYNLSNAMDAIAMYENDVYNYGTPDYLNVRDLSMAKNATAIIERYQNSKMILWAHNYHLKNSSDSMGRYLKDNFGSDFANFCLTTRKGYLTAYSATDSLGKLSNFKLNEDFSESLEYKIWLSYLPERFLMNTRDLVNHLDIKDSLLMLDVGAVYDAENYLNNYITTRLEMEYDYIIYIDSTNALN